MSDSTSPIPASLLPEGFRDRLPRQAMQQTKITRAMLDVLAGYGYERVSPPLAEFEATLSQRMSDGGRSGLMRVTDPVSGRTLAIRSDITMQIGRLASSSLAATARPMRLSYHGQILRLRSNQLRPDRELSQLGAELIGRDHATAAAEIVAMALEALEAAGVTGITVDFTLPNLVEELATTSLKLQGVDIDALRTELDMKDSGAIQAMGAKAYLPLLEATGPFTVAVEKLGAFASESGILTEWIQGLHQIAERLGDKVQITLDPTERHGFEYQSWFGFTLFAHGYPVALGRGGTYMIAHPDGSYEPATGFSLYPDPIVATTTEPDTKRLFLPLGTDATKAARMRAEGWITIAALSAEDDASRLNCGYILSSGRAVPVG